MIALALGCAAPDAARYDGHVVVRVPIRSTADLAHLEGIGGDLWSEHVEDTAEVRLSPRGLGQLRLPHEVLIADVQDAIEASAAGGGSGFFDDWRPLDEILDQLDLLDATSADAQVWELGVSVEGNPIRGLRISPAGDTDRPLIVVTGVQHAREWVAGSSASWIAQHLVEGIGVDPEVDDLLARYHVMVVPIVNPDGYDFTWTTDRLWRKNRRDNGDGTFGVDLNRNWDAAWGGTGSSGSGSSDNYRGAAPFSEPETAALRDLVEAHPRVALHLDLHCTGQVVLSPWAFTETPPPDAALLDAGGEAADLAMSAVHGTSYDWGAFNTRLYPASGVAIDWSYGVHGSNAWLFELRDRGQYGFLLPADQLVPTAEEAWAGLVALAAQPSARLGLVVPPLLAGSPATARATRTDEGATVDLWWSTTGLGSTLLAGGVELEIDAATLLDSDLAGNRGQARLGWTVPVELAGQTVWLQATDGALRSVVVKAEVP